MKTQSKIAFAGIATLCAWIWQPQVIAQGGVNPNNAPNMTKSRSSKVAVVELFTSEGCSSCPPADAVLSRLKREQPVSGVKIIPLSESVPYWDYIGWKDPHAKESFTARQKEYCQKFANDSLYTPQAVINGISQTTGSNYSEILRLIGATSAATDITIDGNLDRYDNRLKLTATLQLPTRTDKSKLMLTAFVVEDNLTSNVTKGENAGARISHDNVVRDLLNLEQITTNSQVFIKTINLQPGWKPKNLSTVIIVQDKTTKAIYAATQINISSK